MTNVSETTKTAVLKARYFESAPTHGVDFVACGTEVRRRETAEAYVV